MHESVAPGPRAPSLWSGFFRFGAERSDGRRDNAKHIPAEAKAAAEQGRGPRPGSNSVLKNGVAAVFATISKAMVCWSATNIGKEYLKCYAPLRFYDYQTKSMLLKIRLSRRYFKYPVLLELGKPFGFFGMGGFPGIIGIRVYRSAKEPVIIGFKKSVFH